ncbi:MAG TPA: SDR family oxidoreductase [Bradyrhizobium sp.]|uniref:SDR family oxidoreductase n=1 Tax=Bradyrhizobium sp. TaxID=376 RepID=UPI002D7ECAF8|nr:SDR family oxidoreductase [Bradyrhizobium sp.]HET7885947.1 SDR family oxidoreductase [Bradyrhizobium sp.]
MTEPILKDRYALITGATAGLGLAVAEKLAAAGANIVLNGLDDGSKAAADLAARFGVKAIFIRADLSQESEIEAMMKDIVGRFDRLDIVINNAVVRSFAPVEAFAPADWNRALAVNLSAPFHIIRLALAGMKQRGFGRIVNMSSIYGSRATENRIDYVTTKTAIVGLTRSVALETVKTGITCNAVSPGTLPTPAIEHRIAAIAAKDGLSPKDAERRYLSERQPSGRFVELGAVGDLIVFLCSPSAADITGAVLPIDGGWAAA